MSPATKRQSHPFRRYSSSFAGVTSYASGIQYRAWGAPKSVNYGDAGTATTSYNSRLQPTQYLLTAPPAPASWNVGISMREQFQYYADGRLQRMTDLDDTNTETVLNSSSRHFSRAYSYDHVGRVTGATGIDAGGQNGFLPLVQYYSYDAFDNLTSRYGSYYYQQTLIENAPYQNNRRTDWSYDADGRVKHSPIIGTNGAVVSNRDWEYDADGRMTQAKDTKTSDNSTATLMTMYDGDGRAVREYVQENVSNTNYYMMRSSVMGGSVVTRLNNAGNKSKTMVQVDGLLTAVQEVSGSYQIMQWMHTDPLQQSEVMHTSGNNKAIYDPLGNYISFQNVPTSPVQPSYYGSPAGGPGSLFGFNGSSTHVTCTMDFGPVDCNMALLALNRGEAWECPNNNCGARVVGGHVRPLITD